MVNLSTMAKGSVCGLVVICGLLASPAADAAGAAQQGAQHFVEQGQG